MNYDLELQQYLQDEYLAILLQNEEFVGRLESDHEFINTLNNSNSNNNNNISSNNNNINKIDVTDYMPQNDANYSYGTGK